jgi:hypothetical protein
MFWVNFDVSEHKEFQTVRERTNSAWDWLLWEEMALAPERQIHLMGKQRYGMKT